MGYKRLIKFKSRTINLFEQQSRAVGNDPSTCTSTIKKVDICFKPLWHGPMGHAPHGPKSDPRMTSNTNRMTAVLFGIGRQSFLSVRKLDERSYVSVGRKRIETLLGLGRKPSISPVRVTECHHSSRPASAIRRWIGNRRKLMIRRVPVLMSAVVAMRGATLPHR